MSNGVLYSMAMYPNICTHIHLPVQSGSDRMLDKMNRKYDSATYLERIDKIREIIPDAAITTDIIAGFCSETEEDHQATIELLKKVRFDSAFMFQYSQRPNTKAARHFDDDVPLETKTRRLNEIIELQSAISLERNKECIGKTYEVLIEGTSKRDSEQLFGRTLGNKVCVFSAPGYKAGDYAKVKVESCTSATLIATLVK
jgi:tRNA-2-methylthio-N6-dimethylallyladenosine synthase